VLFIISFVITQGFEKLAEANRMKSEFVSIVSHQLRSPLTNLKWALDFLTSADSSVPSVKKEEYYRILKENAVRMGDLIDNLLIVSRMEQGKILSKKEEISLKELIEEMIGSFETFATASNVGIEFKSQDDLPKITVDKYQIKLLLDNLFSNAIRYSKGGGKVEAFLLKKNKCLYFEIKDSGVGIPKEDQKFIFQKFFRAQNANRHQTQGSGLGLYIAKSVVDNMNGHISFKSVEGEGSAFSFTIPIK
jgi:signal transduction histidine kinase